MMNEENFDSFKGRLKHAMSQTQSWISSFLLVIFLLPGGYKASLYIDFEVQRDFIAEMFCIEREKPITVCYGQCYLTSQMEKTEKSPLSSRAPKSTSDIKTPPFTLADERQACCHSYLLFSSECYINENRLHPRDHHKALFRPPENNMV
jgi:hypothetical protein